MDNWFWTLEGETVSLLRRFLCVRGKRTRFRETEMPNNPAMFLRSVALVLLLCWAAVLKPFAADMKKPESQSPSDALLIGDSQICAPIDAHT